MQANPYAAPVAARDDAAASQALQLKRCCVHEKHVGNIVAGAAV